MIDDLSGSLEHILEIAEDLAPFPRHTNYYPGIRRIFAGSDTTRNAYVEESCERAAQFIADAFDIDVFDLVEASFSMVTLEPTRLTPPQRAPHFDTTDQKDIALLHYLRAQPNSETAFFRQRATGIERVTELNVSAYIPVAEVQFRSFPRGWHRLLPRLGRIFRADRRSRGRPGPDDHLSRQPAPFGDFSADMPLTGDPRQGRLTANIFIRGR